MPVFTYCLRRQPCNVWISRLLPVAGLALHACLAAGQPAPWPSKSVKVIMPFPEGGQLGVVTRLVTNRLSTVIVQPVLVDVHAGAGGNIATEIIAKAPSDGFIVIKALPLGISLE